MHDHPSIAGSIFRTNPYMNEFMRFRYEMKDPVDGPLFARCVEKMRDRFPYFFVRTDMDEKGNIKVTPNPLPVSVTEGIRDGVIYRKEANYQMQSVQYRGKILCVDISHGFTDGLGTLKYLKSVMYYYVKEKYGVMPDCGHIDRFDDPVPGEELLDCLSDVLYDEALLPAPPEELPEAVHFRELGLLESADSQPMRYEIAIPEKEFVSYSKSVGGTPFTMPAVFLAKTLFELHPVLKKPIVVAVPVNARDALGCPGNPGCAISVVNLVLEDSMRSWSTEELARHIRALMKEKLSVPALRGAGKATILMDKALADCPDKGAMRREMVALSRKSFGHCTFMASYLGPIGWGELENYFTSVFGLVQTTPDQMIIEMIASGGVFNLAMLQSFENKVYINKFMDIMRREGLPFTLRNALPHRIVNAVPEFWDETDREEIQ